MGGIPRINSIRVPLTENYRVGTQTRKNRLYRVEITHKIHEYLRSRSEYDDLWLLDRSKDYHYPYVHVLMTPELLVIIKLKY